MQRLSHTTASDSKGKLYGPICYLCQDNVANCILQKWYRRFLSQQEFSLSLLRTKNVCNSLFSVSISHRKPLSSPSFQHKSLELFRKVKLNSAFSLSQKRCSQNAEMIHQYRQDYNTYYYCPDVCIKLFCLLWPAQVILRQIPENNPPNWSHWGRPQTEKELENKYIHISL